MLFSAVLRIAGRTSINVLSNMFGLPGEIYYPKGYKSGRSGYDDEIEYSDKPDWKGLLLAPFVFMGSKPHFGGFYDELNSEEKAIYFDDTMNIPYNSLVVLKLEGGTQLYKVSDLLSNNDDLGHIYTKAIVVPVIKENEHTSDKKEKNVEFVKEELDKKINIDNSIDEFLNDLQDKNFLEMENAIETKEEEKIEKSNKKIGNDKFIEVFDANDLL